MNRITALAIVALIVLGLMPAGTNAQPKGDTMTNQEQIKHLLERYEGALNASDANAAAALYAADGVFMPTNAPTAVGTTGLRAAYEHVFGMIKLDIAFSIDEIVGIRSAHRRFSRRATLVPCARSGRRDHRHDDGRGLPQRYVGEHHRSARGRWDHTHEGCRGRQ